MYAAQKYSAEDRIATAQHWARAHPDRVPIVLSSPHWPFHSFKCLMAPGTLVLAELGEIVRNKWGYKFSTPPDRVILEVVPGSCPLPPTTIDPAVSCAALSKHHANSDGLLYLAARVIH
jgi:hypothetical protein